jgi:hexulose-6-phosphate isomerase
MDAGSVAGKNVQLKKALMYGILPGTLSVADRFKLAVDLGFEGVEVQTMEDDKAVAALRTAADKAGVRIHSVMNSQSWKYPLSDNDSAVVAKGLDVLRTSLRQAKAFGADAVLLIPAVVTPEVRYKDAWERSQRQIRKVLPLARELGMVIAIENVGNRFLLSPLEFARYIDEMNDPYLQAYFDIGNSRFLWGYPQDWILTLGRRIRKFHLKDCDFNKKRFVLLRDGDVNWPAVRQAIERIGYSGFLTVEPNYSCPELKRGDRAYLAKISKRVDLIFEGK